MPDFVHLIETGGLLIIALIIFAESGMMVGFLFPGDTLLFSAGILAAQGVFSLPVVIAIIAGAAILGDNCGYQIGKYFGPRLFKKDGLIFRKDHIHRAEKFYEKYGAKTMLVAHFIPIVRSFAPVVAGAANMNRVQFVIYDAIGDIVWAVSLTMLGYTLGYKFPVLEHYIEPVLIGIILLFLIPTLYHAFKDPRIGGAIKRKLGLNKNPKSSEATTDKDEA